MAEPFREQDDPESDWRFNLDDSRYRDAFHRAAEAVHRSATDPVPPDFARAEAAAAVAHMIQVHQRAPSDSLLRAHADAALTRLARMFVAVDRGEPPSADQADDIMRRITVVWQMDARAPEPRGVSFFKSALALLGGGPEPGREDVLRRLAAGAALAATRFVADPAHDPAAVAAELIEYASMHRPDPAELGPHSLKRLHDLAWETSAAILQLDSGRRSHEEFAEAAVLMVHEVRVRMSEQHWPVALGDADGREIRNLFANAADHAASTALRPTALLAALDRQDPKRTGPVLAALQAAPDAPLVRVPEPVNKRTRQKPAETTRILQEVLAGRPTAAAAAVCWFAAKGDPLADELLPAYARALATVFRGMDEHDANRAALPLLVQRAEHMGKDALFRAWQGFRGQPRTAEPRVPPTVVPTDLRSDPVLRSDALRNSAARAIQEVRRLQPAADAGEPATGAEPGPDADLERAALGRIEEAEQAAGVLDHWATQLADPALGAMARDLRDALAGLAASGPDIDPTAFDHMAVLDTVVQPALGIAARAANLQVLRGELGLDNGLGESTARDSALRTVAALTGRVRTPSTARALAALDVLPRGVRQREKVAWEINWQTLVARERHPWTGRDVPVFPVSGARTETLAELVEGPRAVVNSPDALAVHRGLAPAAALVQGATVNRVRVAPVNHRNPAALASESRIPAGPAGPEVNRADVFLRSPRPGGGPANPPRGGAGAAADKGRFREKR